MRLRKDNLKTGNLLAIFDKGERARNRGILFLIEGSKDIVTSIEIEKICKNWANAQREVECKWCSVADQWSLSAYDPLINPQGIVRIESCEFAGLPADKISHMLLPALDRLAGGRKELFPSAGGAVGAIAEDIQFIGRDDDIMQLEKLILNNEHILLAAPRRSGKTSLLNHLEKMDWDCHRLVLLDLERFSSVEDVVAKLWSIAYDERPRLARRNLQGKKLDEALNAVIEQIAGGSGKVVVLILDELVFFLEELGKNETSHKVKVLDFFSLLSTVIEKSKAQIVVSGSFDLDEFLSEKTGLEKDEIPFPFGSLHRYALRPLPQDGFNTELRRILIGTGIVPDAGDIEWLERNLDFSIPYPSISFLDHLSSLVRSQGYCETLSLDSALTHYLDIADVFNEFETQIRRQGVKHPDREESIYRALDSIAQSEEGSEISEIRALFSKDPEIYKWLIETFPLYEEMGKIRIASLLWRRWWRRQEGLES
ncbi:MAG: hypothetical protein AB9903_03710 [Vulcanimicrobiota bacterium]